MNKRTEIVPAKRRAVILDHLRSRGAASIAELSDAIDASESTIRRDLDHLVEHGFLERTHGGATLLQRTGTTFEREPHLNAQPRRAHKERIGRTAAERFRDGDSVIFDSSSTVFETARAVARRELSLTVITNSLDIAQFAAGIRSWRVIMPGGTIRPGSQFLAGEQMIAGLQELSADLLLLGAVAVNESGAIDATVEVAHVKRAMVAAARRRILVVDSSKFDDVGLCAICRLDDIDEMITDAEADRVRMQRLAARGARVTIA